MMDPAVIIILLLYKMYSAQAVRNSELLVVSAEPGKTVTLNCTPVDDSNANIRMWYKQRLRHAPVEVGSQFKDKKSRISASFDQSRFKMNRIASGTSVSIERVTKEDEGVYFCATPGETTINFSNATFLSVTGQSIISVLQTTVQGSVSPGESVTGNGTAVELKAPVDPVDPVGPVGPVDPVDPVMLTLAVFSAVCVAVICAEAILIHKLRKSKHCAGGKCSL
ncbi:uncharacterized protein LOC118807310 [Colossoma macropomum]|uniref:uncharacterized protein LOC118807310 n=1 Tax=Colossoma macropomum TaxID=42526 RepID=UPI0018649934|nr:uncharacterized protein LOC118807310 [Colossoma macropomum]